MELNNNDDKMEIEKDILDFKDEPDKEIKINPDYYIHTGLLMAQKSLVFSVAKGSVSEGITSFFILIEQIEVLAKAAEYIGEEYEAEIKKYLRSDEYLSTEKKEVQMAKLANKKLYYIMKEVFGKAPLDTPLKY